MTQDDATPGAVVGTAPPASAAAILAAFAAIYLIWGSTYLAIRIAIETIPPFLMAGIRSLIAGALLFGWGRIVRREPLPDARAIRAAAVVGLLMLLGGNGAVTWAEQHVPSGIAAVLVATVPLWMVLLEGRRPSAGILAGVALGLAGVGLLVGPAEIAGSGRVDPIGAAVLVGGSLSWCIGSLVSRRLPLPTSPNANTALQMLAGGGALTLLGTIVGEWPRVDLAAISVRSALAVLYLIVFGSLIGYVSYVWLLRQTTPARVATYAYVNPVVAVLLGWAFAGEPLTLRTLLAAAVIVGAVAFIITHREPAPRAPLVRHAGRDTEG